MLQDILPHRLDISFHPAAPGPESRALVFDGEKLLAAQTDRGMTLPRLADCAVAERPLFAFRLDETDFFLLLSPTAAVGFSMLPVSVLRRTGPKETAFAALDGPDTITVQQSELSEAAWIPRGEIALRAEDFSLTGELIARFVQGREPR